MTEFESVGFVFVALLVLGAEAMIQRPLAWRPVRQFLKRFPGAAVSFVRVLVLDALVVGAYWYVVSREGSWDAVGWHDVGLYGTVICHWLIWALAAIPAEPSSDTPKGWLENRYVRLALVLALMVGYALAADPYIPSGTLRYVHSHRGPMPALQEQEVRCGPLLQAVVPFVDRVFDYPLGYQRMEFSEGGDLPPIRTETRNGHEVELDVVVVYRMFPRFEVLVGKDRTPKDCEEAARKHYADDGLSPPRRFGREWARRLVEPLVQRVVRDNVTRYYLNQVYSSTSRALIQGMVLAELNGQPSRRLVAREQPRTLTAAGEEIKKASYMRMNPGPVSDDTALVSLFARVGALLGVAVDPQRLEPPYLIELDGSAKPGSEPEYFDEEDRLLATLRGRDARPFDRHSLAGPMFTFREVVVLDVRILDREFADRIRRKHLKEEAREELLIESRRLQQELDNVQLRKDIEAKAALIEADKIKIIAEAELQRARLEAQGIQAKGTALATARKQLVAAHGEGAKAAENYVRIQMAESLAAGIDRVIITPELENLVPIVGDIGKVMDRIPGLLRELPTEEWYDKQKATKQVETRGGPAPDQSQDTRTKAETAALEARRDNASGH